MRIIRGYGTAHGRSHERTAARRPGRRPRPRRPDDGPLVIVYADFTLPALRGRPRAAAGAPVRTRLPPLRAQREAPARRRRCARAAEAAAVQGAFWPFHDALFADQGRIDDPHLWARARALGPRPRPLRGRPAGRGGRRAGAPRRARGDARQGSRRRRPPSPGPRRRLRMLGYPGAVRIKRSETARRPMSARRKGISQMSST